MLSFRRFASTKVVKPVVAKGSVCKKLSFTNQVRAAVAKQTQLDVLKLYQTRTYDGSVDGDLWHGNGKITYENGKTLEGEFRAGKLYTGYGTIMYCTTGTIYEGHFVEGQANGQGRETFADGRYLQGEWEYGMLMNGHGVMSRRDYVYEGQFQDGKRHGQGKWTSLVGNSYEGAWEDGKQHGQGTFTYADGSVLQGEFQNGSILNGHGVFPLCGVRYEGQFVEGALHGTAKITYPDGSRYVGDSVNKKRHGHGTLTFKTGQSITGEWKNGSVYNAQGTYILSDGTVLAGTWIKGVNAQVPDPPPAPPTDGSHYEGAMVNYKYHGKGKLTNPDGSMLAGEFRNGQIFAGKGVQVSSRGEKCVGVWKDGVLTGPVKLYPPDGSVFHGTMAGGDSKEEMGKLRHPDGAIYAGQWLHGKPHGTGKLTTHAGEVYVGAFAAGKKHGQGKLVQKHAVYEGQWANNLFHGTGALAYKNGMLLQGEFRQGRIYAGNGTIQIDGSHTFSGEWVEGYRHGHGKVTWADGTVLFEGEWIHGVVVNSAASSSNATNASNDALNVDYGQLLHTSLEGQFAGGDLILGTLVSRDGTVYHGDIKQGKYHGSGTRTDPSGDVHQCTWVAGVREGPGKIIYANGQEWVGEFKNGTVYTGSGVYKSKAGVLQGIWVRGAYTAASLL